MTVTYTILKYETILEVTIQHLMCKYYTQANVISIKSREVTMESFCKPQENSAQM